MCRVVVLLLCLNVVLYLYFSHRTVLHVERVTASLCDRDDAIVQDFHVRCHHRFFSGCHRRFLSGE